MASTAIATIVNIAAGTYQPHINNVIAAMIVIAATMVIIFSTIRSAGYQPAELALITIEASLI